MTNINTHAKATPLSWQEQAAIDVLKLCNPNLRPGNSVVAGLIQSKSITAGFEFKAVLEGVNLLEERGALKVVDDHIVELTDEGYHKHW